MVGHGGTGRRDEETKSHDAMADEVDIHYSEFDDVNLSQIELQMPLIEEGNRYRAEDLTQFDPTLPVFSQAEACQASFSQDLQHIPSPVLDIIRSSQPDTENAETKEGKSDDGHQSLKTPGSATKRRGPMDNMRQLVRILMTLIPQAESLLDASVNVLKEDAIRKFLDQVLGDAPRPEWGSDAWAEYLSALFSWARTTKEGKEVVVTAEQARLCADRLPGRCWTINRECLAQLQLSPVDWTLPLSKTSFSDADLGGEKNKSARPHKRKWRDKKPIDPPVTIAGQDIASLSELEILQWTELFGRIAKKKARIYLYSGSQRPNASECDALKQRIGAMMSEDWECPTAFVGGSQNLLDPPSHENK